MKRALSVVITAPSEDTWELSTRDGNPRASRSPVSVRSDSFCLLAFLPEPDEQQFGHGKTMRRQGKKTGAPMRYGLESAIIVQPRCNDNRNPSRGSMHLSLRAYLSLFKEPRIYPL